MMSRSRLRFTFIAALLIATGLLLHVHGQSEPPPERRPLVLFPFQIGSWNGENSPIAPDDLEVLGRGDFLNRVYRSKDRNSIDLFLAYFPSQRTGDTIHSPKNCLPGAGWAPIQSGRIHISAADGRSIPVNRDVIVKGTRRDLVLYWYQAHGRYVASEFSAKFYLVADSIRLNRTDGALVRIITPIDTGEDPAAAQLRAVSFAQQILPFLNSYIPP